MIPTWTLQKVRRIVERAYAKGRLGVLAATENIPEGRLREFALGDVNALTAEEISRINWRAADV